MPLTEQIVSLALQAIKEGLFPGCVVAFSTGARRDVIAIGGLTYDANAPRVTADTVYDLASVTKSIPTALLAVHLIDRGVLALDERVCELVPELSMPRREAVLLRHLLTFQLSFGFGLAAVRPAGASGVLDAIWRTPFSAPVGMNFVYANATTILLGAVLERATGESLSRLSRTRLFEPLGLTRLTFDPSNCGNVAPSEVDGERSLVQGVVHDETAFLFRETGRQIASAGLFGDAADLRTVLEAVVKQTPLVEADVMSTSAIQMMLTRQTPERMPAYGLGWNLNEPAFMGECAGSSTFGKTGFTGCSVAADWRAGWSAVILCNSTYPSRNYHPNRAPRMNQFRAAVTTLIARSCDA